jgi:hypothetical protein
MTAMHIRVVLGNAQERFKLSETQMAAGGLPYRYLAIYEVVVRDIASATEALRANSGRMVIDPALDRSRTVACFYTPIRERVEA